LILDTLYGIFPRDVSVPDGNGNLPRKTIYTRHSFYNHIETLNACGHHCYTSVYDTRDDITIDKVVFDIDSSNLNKSLKEAKILHQRLSEFPHLIVFSGTKGFHIYCFFKPKILSREMGSYFIQTFQEKYQSGLKTVDPHLIGNVSAMIRVPNTINKGRYCTYISSKRFQSMSIDDILEESKGQHRGRIDFTLSYKSITDLIDGNDPIIKEPSNFFFTDKVSDIPNLEILHHLIRPCIMKEMLKPDRGQERGPRHVTRLNFVSEMLHLNFSKEQIFETIKLFNMGDFNEEKTWYQISKICDNRTKPYGCIKLRESISCSKCGWRYWW